MKKRQRLGQHFLKSGTVARKVVDSAVITKKDVVLEIGTGKGILVPLLCDKAKKVISIESDYALYKNTKERFSDINNLELEQTDGFKSIYSYIGVCYKIVKGKYFIKTVTIE